MTTHRDDCRILLQSHIRILGFLEDFFKKILSQFAILRGLIRCDRLGAMKARRFAITPKHIVLASSLLVVAAFAGYFFYELLPVFRAPKIVLDAPSGDLIVEEPELTLRGHLEGGTRLQVNHEDVYVDEEGEFLQAVWLALGVNVIEMTAENKFGRQSKLVRYIIFQQNADY